MMLIASLRLCNTVTLTGNEHPRLSLPSVVKRLLNYCGITRNPLRYNRNERIRLRFADGQALSDLARAFGLSPQRIFQIVHY